MELVGSGKLMWQSMWQQVPQGEKTSWAIPSQKLMLGNLRDGMAVSGFFFLSIIPYVSERSCSSPSGNLQSNECKSEAKIYICIFSAKGTPRQSLLPEPNGMNFKLFPLKSYFSVPS
ncbi:hypothetical protein OSB04_010173 [Centaurea solstitialis]|uniref:Uncharacterized protein n=1 Tax=Centaurea solstitialis TaxID=347529 RepID=A0AA38WMV4_9ASTR|nr:hypothetical protein OSB04_010173 [Centaurea solstitialis]